LPAGRQVRLLEQFLNLCFGRPIEHRARHLDP
jgi:hypothetical protein